ncbi:MAG TPA: hypothetical protein VE175_09335, partial [Woeseiaceae bacterium]|nr:hypothetical protein [Woeseiaceae bacterium]
FGVRSVMGYSDLVFFGAEFDFDALDLHRVVAMDAIVALAAAATAAAIYPVRSARDAPAATAAPAGAAAWAWRLGAAVALYVAAYWIAGMFIAWSSPAVAEFYGGEAFLASVNVPALFGFQVLRGLAWSGLVVLVLASHRGPLVERALAAATAVAALLAVMLVYPNDLMPEAVRYRHMIEIAVSNMAWGLAASVLLAPLAGHIIRRPRSGQVGVVT